MREARMKVLDERWVAHVTGRSALQGPVFGPDERTAFCDLLDRVSDFCGVGVLTYCVMPDHYHLLIDVPAPADVDDTELIRRTKNLYGAKAAAALSSAIRQNPDAPETAALKQLYLRKSGDLSPFMKLLLQRFGVWFNRVHKRSGTLWGDRFKSLIVEPKRDALQIVAAYLDLNPVRARLVKDPRDYPWCGYGDAHQGSKRARRGLAVVLDTAGQPWKRTEATYRSLLFKNGSATPDADDDATCPLPELLRRRIRYFSDGAILGSPDYVQRIFEQLRERGWFGPKRTTGPRAIQGAESLGSLRVLRALRVDAIG